MKVLVTDIRKQLKLGSVISKHDMCGDFIYSLTVTEINKHTFTCYCENSHTYYFDFDGFTGLLKNPDLYNFYIENKEHLNEELFQI